MENEKINKEKTDENLVTETSEQEVEDILNEKQLEIEEEDCRDPEDFLNEQNEIKDQQDLKELLSEKVRLVDLVCELRKEIQSNYFETTEEKAKLINENSKFKVLNEDLNKSLDSFENIQTQKNLETLISAVNAASNAYEKVPTEQVRGAAKGLALAAIGKLHMFIDKI